MNAQRRSATVTTLILLLLSPAVRGQGSAPAKPGDDKAAGQDQAAVAMKAKVIEVKGSVAHAPVGTDPLDAVAWKTVRRDMELGADTQIRTGLRSRCVLLFGDPPDQTVISVRRATLASISDFRRTQTEQRIRIGLGYGAVRGGSSEGTLRSSVIIDSPVATLAKRGTEGYQIEVEPVTGHFRVSLARSGLVEALSHAHGRRKTVRAGEYASDENIARMWISQAIFDRAVKFFEVGSVSPADLNFMAQYTTGFSSIAPDGSQLGSSVRAEVGLGARIPARNLQALLGAFRTLLIENPPLSLQRPEGNFGLDSTFRVLAPRIEGRESAARILPPGTRRGTLWRSKRRPLVATRQR